MPWVLAKKTAGHGQRSHWDGLQGSRLKGVCLQGKLLHSLQGPTKIPLSQITPDLCASASQRTLRYRMSQETEIPSRAETGFTNTRLEVSGSLPPPKVPATLALEPAKPAVSLEAWLRALPRPRALSTPPPPNRTNVLISHHCLLTTPLMGRHPVLNTCGLPESPPPLLPEPDLSAFVVSPPHSE